MRERVCGTLILAAVAGLALSSAGQVAPVRQKQGAAGSATRTARLPYTAEFRTTTVRTLANGSTVTQETTEIVARDSQGRQMLSTTSTPISEGQPVRTMININDPVGHTHSFWVVPGDRVTVTNLPAPDAVRASCPAPTLASPPQRDEAQRAQPTTEDLGTQSFQGLEARGHRSTWTIPVGSIGNSEQLVHTSEAWFSTTPGLTGINVRQVNDDPQTGLSTRELVRFTQGEPDAAQFQPPQDYEIVAQETHDEVRCPQ